MYCSIVQTKEANRRCVSFYAFFSPIKTIQRRCIQLIADNFYEVSFWSGRERNDCVIQTHSYRWIQNRPIWWFMLTLEVEKRNAILLKLNDNSVWITSVWVSVYDVHTATLKYLSYFYEKKYVNILLSVRLVVVVGYFIRKPKPN